MNENQTNKPRLDVYQMVTDRIITALEKGVVPWKQPWKKAGPPQNLITGKVYRGVNFWLLLAFKYAQNYFLSFKQIKELGGKVKQGEKAHMIVFWKQVPMEDPETGEKRDLPFLRYYTVFNVAQCELPEGKVPSENVNHMIKSCEDIVTEMPQPPMIRHKEGKAFYNPLKDFVNMPPFNTFHTPEGYYSTLFHELVHSTGHQSRLNRKELLQMSEFGSEEYSIEELTAEIGACYLKSITGIDQDDLENNTAYIQGWLRKLKNDNRFIVYGSTQAQKATDFILNVKIENSVEAVSDDAHPEEKEDVF
jgi:antirestriction protein ArdC